MRLLSTEDTRESMRGEWGREGGKRGMKGGVSGGGRKRKGEGKTSIKGRIER